ncbi:hypothetical protein PIB30_045799 [Stylosanthes scabra]|uniref:Uncharacterized protein n=1 Tax=Stylosanthes scabra TaxID=79078 RepID=A0ABU6ZF14_9FABA|nr:hypothetical protein [Stylosanthes scabra]
MIGAGKNGPPGKYERWLSIASSGSVGLAMITDRVWRSFRTENPWVGDSHSVYSSDFSALRNWSNMFATWLIGFGVLHDLRNWFQRGTGTSIEFEVGSRVYGLVLA